MGKFDFVGFAKEVHQVAVEHGWWEGERDEAEICALIHSEWSEALEEHRAGRPMVWRECINTRYMCDREACGEWDRECGACGAHDEGKKPEGIAVELIDGVLRCMDFLAEKDCFPRVETLERALVHSLKKLKDGATLPALVDTLHVCIALARVNGDSDMLWVAVLAVFAWLEKNGVDPEAVIRMKHEYNKTRPYKHGKRY